MSEPTKLAAVRARRGDLDAVALLRALIEDIEKVDIRPTTFIVVCGKDEGAHAYRVDVRMAGGSPLVALGLLEAAKAQILGASVEAEDVE